MEYINKVRNARGISRTYDIIYNSMYTDSYRIEVLLKEYQKDFFAEGQFFYFLKRHNQSTFYRCPVSQMSYYVFPIPDDEIEFGTMESDELYGIIKKCFMTKYIYIGFLFLLLACQKEGIVEYDLEKDSIQFNYEESQMSLSYNFAEQTGIGFDEYGYPISVYLGDSISRDTIS